jgi:hypothetical protein
MFSGQFRGHGGLAARNPAVPCVARSSRFHGNASGLGPILYHSADRKARAPTLAVANPQQATGSRACGNIKARASFSCFFARNFRDGRELLLRGSSQNTTVRRRRPQFTDSGSPSVSAKPALRRQSCRDDNLLPALAALRAIE